MLDLLIKLSSKLKGHDECTNWSFNRATGICYFKTDEATFPPHDNYPGHHSYAGYSGGPKFCSRPACYNPRMVDGKSVKDTISADVFRALGGCETNSPVDNYWLGLKGSTDGGHMVIDLGCCVATSSVKLVNSYNHKADNNERSVKRANR